MSRYFLLFLLVFVNINCANRGYDTLSLEVPELFPGFTPESYTKNETPKNIMYVENDLPEEEKTKDEFYEKEYQLKKQSSYLYYIPNTRQPSSFLDKDKYKDWPKIRIKNSEALLIK